MRTWGLHAQICKTQVDVSPNLCTIYILTDMLSNYIFNESTKLNTYHKYVNIAKMLNKTQYIRGRLRIPKLSKIQSIRLTLDFQ